MDGKAKNEQVMRDINSKNDQIIRETFQKLAQVILQARVVFPVTPPAQKRINKWFNLETEELDSIMRDMLPWQGNLHAPLFLEVYFSSTEPLPHPDYSPLLERWKIVYQPSVGTTSIEFPTVYKHLVLLVRGVAGILRVMPAFRAYCNCQRSKAGGMNSNAEVRYSFHSSFPSSREFSPSRSTLDCTFDPVISPFGSLTVSVIYRVDCSVEIGATDPIIKAHFIKDYSPSEYTPSTSPPKKNFTPETTPSRSAPIGIPGKDKIIDTMMPMVSSPPSSLTMMSPGQFAGAPFPQHSTPPSVFRQNSLPVQYSIGQPPTSTSPVGIPSAPNRVFSHPAFSSSPTSSSAGGFGQASSGSAHSHALQAFNSSSTSASTNSTSTSNSSSSTGNSGNNINVNSGKLRPRAASYAPPSTSLIPATSTTSPLSGTPPYSHSVFPRLPYSTSPSKESYGTSPTTHSPTSSSPLTSTSPTAPFTLRPATNMYMSTLLGPSIHLHSSPLNPYEVPALLDAFDELAFAGEIPQSSALGGVHRKETNIEMGEIGEFVRMCKSAPTLQMFSSPKEKRVVGSSFLFADMTTSQIKNQLIYFSLNDSH